MYRIDNASNTNALPTPTAAGPNPGGFFEDKDPANGIEGTIVPAEWLNMVQEEIANVIEDGDAGNTSLSKASRTQLKEAILALIAAQGNGTPAGVVEEFAGTVLPSGYLWCYGQAVSRTTYATLYAAIGTTYGAGNGTTTFNVPDRRGRVGLGKDDMGGTPANNVVAASGKTLGGTGGSENVQLGVNHLPPHTHTVNGYAGTEPGNNRGVLGGGSSYQNTGQTGGNEAHPNMPPYLTMNYIIKT